MTTNRQITTSELDFDTIKSNLIAFLRNQSTLTDYEYDGSVMSVLLDVLAYNTHYNSLYTNLAINEMFIDSASKRASLVSIAKLMGYRARSITSARAKIDVSVVVEQQNTNVFTIPAGTIFSTVLDNEIYKFTTLGASTQRITSGSTFVFNDLEIVEGVINTITYTKSNTPVDNFVIPERNADISTLTVDVFENGSTVSTPVSYNLENSLMSVKPDTLCYFIKQREDLFYEVYFGNDVFGKALQPGNVVKLSYVISKGQAANRATTFVYSSGATGQANYYITTTQAAAGGAPEESTDTIRFNAPKSFAASHRAVTADDYVSVLINNFPSIDCVNVWGGQDNVPPVYGKVFIAAKPLNRDRFTREEKSNMIDSLVSRLSVLTVKPEFVDPNYIEIQLLTNVYYDPKLTTLTPTDISTAVSNVISAYRTKLGKFNATYRHSHMSRLIDAADRSIISNISNIVINYDVNVTFGKEYDYKLFVGNPIDTSGTAYVRTNKFYHNNYSTPCYIKNVGLDLYLFTQDSKGNPIQLGKAGYYTARGDVVFTKLNIIGLVDPYLKISFTPYSYDVIPVNNYIVRMLDPTINIIVDSVSQNAQGAQTHIFSSSR